MPPLQIGAVARRSGLSVKTIRFYCDEGLIQPIGRSHGGYRQFGEEVFAELSLIRTLRAMELPLQDVRDPRGAPLRIMHLPCSAGTDPCQGWRNR